MSDDESDEIRSSEAESAAAEAPAAPARPRKKKRRPAAERAVVEDPFRPGALRVLLALLALGAVVATYMAVAHLLLFHGTGSFHSICNFGARLSCDAVNTSDESEVGGVAIAVLAPPAYAALAFLAVKALRAEPSRRRAPLALAHGLAWAMTAYSAYLFGVMAFKLGTFCLFCLTLDLVNVASVIATARAAGAGPRALLSDIPGALRSERRVLWSAVGIGAATLAVALGGHAWLRSSLEADARAAVMAPSEPASGAPVASGAPPDEAEGEGAPQGHKLPTKRWQVPIADDDASVGPKDAKVTVVQFADFQCGYCKKLEASMAAVRHKYASEVRFVFKHFPMSPRCNRVVQNEKHKYACEAAISAECARRQGKFWPMHDVLYRSQHRLERSDLDGYAAEVGLDPAAYAACMSDPSALEAVMKDTDDGEAVKVAATPRTFINGRLFGGVLSEDLLSFVIDVELGKITGKAAEAYVAPPSKQ